MLLWAATTEPESLRRKTSGDDKHTHRHCCSNNTSEVTTVLLYYYCCHVATVVHQIFLILKCNVPIVYPRIVPAVWWHSISFNLCKWLLYNYNIILLLYYYYSNTTVWMILYSVWISSIADSFDEHPRAMGGREKSGVCTGPGATVCLVCDRPRMGDLSSAPACWKCPEVEVRNGMSTDGRSTHTLNVLTTSYKRLQPVGTTIYCMIELYRYVLQQSSVVLQLL